MKVFVVYDALGKIVSVTQAKHGIVQGVGVMPNAGHSVLEVDLRGEFENKALIDIHNHCSIDLEHKTVVRRSR